MGSIRFGIKQILLLMVLAALVAGLYSTVLRQPVKNWYSEIDLSPDGQKLALLGTQGLEVKELQHGTRIADYRWRGSVISFPWGNPDGARLKFIDNDDVILVRTLFPTPTPRIEVFSVSKNAMVGDIPLQTSAPQVVGSIFGNRYICRDPATEIVEVVDLKTRKTLSAKKFPAPNELALTPDGKFVCSYGSAGLPSKVSFWDYQTKTLVGEMDRMTSRVGFSSDSSCILIDSATKISLFELIPVDSESGFKIEFKERWSREVLGGMQQWQFSRDGRLIAVSENFEPGKVIVLDAENGQTIRELHVGYLNQLFEISLDASQLYVVPKNSDSRIEVWDIASGNRVRSFGANWRLIKAMFYSVLLIGWSAIWGLMSRRQNLLNGLAQRRLSAETPYGPLDDDTSIVDSGEIEVVSRPSDRQKVPTAVTAAWTMMTIGGVFAILWAVVPMFYFQNGFLGNLMPPQLISVRYVLAGYGLLVGVLAVSRGVGRLGHLVQATSILQALNILQLDVLNLALGIAGIALLNQESARRYLQDVMNVRNFELNPKHGH